MRNTHSRPFAEVLDEVRSHSPVPVPEQINLGVVRGTVLTDDDGQQFLLWVDGHLSLFQARKYASTAARVVLDDCGCGGECGFTPLSNEEVERYFAAWEHASKAKRTRQSRQDSFSLWQAIGGATLLMISDSSFPTVSQNRCDSS